MSKDYVLEQVESGLEVCVVKVAHELVVVCRQAVFALSAVLL